jgi:hypothetical protein
MFQCIFVLVSDKLGNEEEDKVSVVYLVLF